MRHCRWRDILNLQTTSNMVELAKQYTRYLHDPSMYPVLNQQYSRAQIPHTGLTKEEERMMSSKWVVIEQEKVKATVHTHKVPEPMKDRSRVVHACRINDIMKELNMDGPSTYSLKSPSEVNMILGQATMVVQYDAKSMYDQFQLEANIPAFFAFQSHDGIICACGSMPMGFNKACGVAQCLSSIIATFEIKNDHFIVYVIVHLDNYCYAFIARYSEPPEEELKKIVTSTIATFLIRTVKVDLQLNEMDREEILHHIGKSEEEQWQAIANMSPEEFTFLGIEYNLRKDRRTKSAGIKTWGKLDSIMACLFPANIMNPATTPRMLAMLMGTLGYITRNCELKHKCYNLHRTISELCYLTWAYPEAWDFPLQDVTQMFSEIPHLVQMAKQKRTSPIYPTAPTHMETMIVISDASASGWGGIVCIPKQDGTWKTSVVAGYWPKLGVTCDPIYQSSTIAEPKAISMIEEQLHSIPAPNVRHCIWVTDHSPLVMAARSTQARCYSYFNALQRLESRTQSYSLLFIPGSINPADEPSRNPNSTNINHEQAQRVARAAGMGYARALQNPNKECIPSVCVDASNADLSLLS